MNSDEQADHRNCASRVRGIQNFHMDDPDRRWSDIAYSFLVCKHGTVFEGRGIGWRTAATGDCNDDSYATCFLGDDTVNRDDVTDLGRDAIAEVHAELERQKRARLGVNGHRECANKPCPGDELFNWLKSPAFRALVEAQKAPKPTFEWYLGDGKGGIVLRAAGPGRLGEKVKNNPRAVREAVLATGEDRVAFGRRVKG